MKIRTFIEIFVFVGAMILMFWWGWHLHVPESQFNANSVIFVPSGCVRSGNSNSDLPQQASRKVRQETVQGLTPSQIKLIELARKIGAPYDLSKALVGILMQETRAGKLGRIGDLDKPFGLRSYGVMQIKVKTAERVLKTFPNIGTYKSEEGLIARLMLDDRFSMEIALGYLRMLKARGLTWRQMLAAYNLGYGGMSSLKHPEHYKYVRGVVQKLQFVTQETDLWQNSNGGPK